MKQIRFAFVGCGSLTAPSGKRDVPCRGTLVAAGPFGPLVGNATNTFQALASHVLKSDKLAKCRTMKFKQDARSGA